MRRGRGRAPWHAAGTLLVAWVVEAGAQSAMPLVVSPPGSAVEVRVGERRAFSASLAQPGVTYSWALDGTRTGRGNQFEFRPTTGFVGRHEVTVTAVAGAAAARYVWVVTVVPAAPPTIVRAVPEGSVVRVVGGETVSFEVEAEPGALTDTVHVRWSLDGTAMGEGPRLTVRSPAAGEARLRAVVTSEYGGAAVREWTITAAPELAALAKPAEPAAPSPARPTTTRPPPPPRPTTTQPPPRPTTTRPAPTPRPTTTRPTPPRRTTTTRPPPPPPRPPTTVAASPPAARPATAVTEDDIRALMFRYEQAWRTRNAAELRRIGHVDTDEQERALASYFATTRDLEVAVHVLDLRVEDGHGVVRFTRRDRFHDPGGREVAKESPPIEKTVVRTPDGVRFAPRS